MIMHELKIWPNFYTDMVEGNMPYTIRLNDRHFQKGDRILFKEFEPGVTGSVGAYTGKVYLKEISSVLSGWGLSPNHVALGLKEVA